MPKRIIAADNFHGIADEVLTVHVDSAVSNLSGSKIYTNLPVDLAVLNSTNQTYKQLIALAKDGGKKAIAEKNRVRLQIIGMMRLLARYVDVTANNDPIAFAASGFEAVVKTPVAPQPLAQPWIKLLEHAANSGQIAVTIGTVSKAKSYELRFAAEGAGGAPGAWTTKTVTAVKAPTVVDGLTPGTIYAFQVRALGTLGYTDFSNSVIFMCT